MPDLPEVETMVRGIKPHVQGRQIATLELPPCRYRPITIRPDFQRISTQVHGTTIRDVWRLAKRIILELDNNMAFAIEPRMTGLMLIDDAPSQEHLRFRWNFKPLTGQPSQLWFWDRRGLGTVSLYPLEELALITGPDALQIDAKQWETICRSSACAIKILLLNPKKVAGIGNLYASEILHRAAISPLRPAHSLTRPQLLRLTQATQSVLQTAILYEGSTLSDGTYRNVLNRDGSYQNEHTVYQKHGHLCTTCQKTHIVRIVQAQRSTFYCTRCQK